MVIGIATANPVKIQAARDAFIELRKTFPIGETVIEFQSGTVASGVADMPLNREEMIKGARQRAETLFEEGAYNWTLGMEGGVFPLDMDAAEPTLMLQNWVCVFTGRERSFGCSAALPLPRSFNTPLLQNGEELAMVIDRFSGKKDVRSREGAFGILSRGLYNRRLAFQQAVINAVIPLVNNQYKGNEHGIG